MPRSTKRPLGHMSPRPTRRPGKARVGPAHHPGHEIARRDAAVRGRLEDLAKPIRSPRQRGPTRAVDTRSHRQRLSVGPAIPTSRVRTRIDPSDSGGSCKSMTRAVSGRPGMTAIALIGLAYRLD